MGFFLAKSSTKGGEGGIKATRSRKSLRVSGESPLSRDAGKGRIRRAPGI